MDIELKVENWTSRPILSTEQDVDKSLDEIPEDRNYTKDYYNLSYNETVAKGISILSLHLRPD